MAGDWGLGQKKRSEARDTLGIFMKGVESGQFKGGCEAKFLDGVLFALYGIFKRRTVRKFILRIVLRIEGGEFYSVTIRRIFARYRQVEIGMYTHGACFVPGSFDRFTTVGRYCSIAADVKVFNRNHPMDFKSMHAFFFNPSQKYTKADMVEYTPLEIGNDVWLGDGVKIMPQVNRIGDGAVIGAGSVVHKDVPPYAVVVGHPARVVRYRFPKEIIEYLLASKWWEKDIEEILPDIEEYQQPYEELFHERKGGE